MYKTVTFKCQFYYNLEDEADFTYKPDGPNLSNLKIDPTPEVIIEDNQAHVYINVEGATVITKSELSLI